EAPDWRPLECESYKQLVRHALNREGAELRVFFAEFSVLNILGVGAPRLDLLHAIPDLNDNALRCIAVKCGYLSAIGSSGSSDRHEATAGCLNEGLSLRDILLRIGIGVGYIDFCDVVDGRLGLCMRVTCLDATEQSRHRPPPESLSTGKLAYT